MFAYRAAAAEHHRFQRINAVAMPIRPKQPIASYNREKHVFSGTFDPASDKYDEDMDGKP